MTHTGSILIVDDGGANRRLLRAVLEAEGSAVLEAADGLEALEVLDREPVDAIISDVLMPNMDGIRLCLEVRKHARWRNLPFLVYTSTYNSASDRKLALDAGADDYVVKPAPAATILASLVRARARASARVVTVAPPAGEVAVIKQYNAALIAKLEERNEELQRAFADLQTSEERFRQLAENIDQVFWLRDVRTRGMVYVSPAFTAIWGRPVEMLRTPPREWEAVIHPDDRARVAAAARRWSGVDEYDEEFRILRPDGAVRWIRDRAFPVRKGTPAVERVAGLAEDVTARKDLEEQFRQAQKMDAIGQLAGGVAHDFNNLLTVIVGHVGLLQEEAGLSADAEESLVAIHEAARRAGSLTRQLLLFSRREAMVLRVLDVNEVVAGIVRMLGRIVGENINLVCETAPVPLPVLADAGMLEQILMNLVVNARDAMPGGGTITIRTLAMDRPQRIAESDPGEGSVQLEVQDGGCGIPEEILPRIFEPFFTTKGAGKGTGLGLATVFGIVQQHRGTIEVQSTIGRGTTFVITLPRRAERELAGSRVSSSTREAGGHETILVVEDDSALRRLIGAMLRSRGYQVLEAATAAEARSHWTEHRETIGLLLTDLVIPRGESGKELAERLRHERPGLAVVLMSGYSAKDASENSEMVEGSEYLLKPFDIEQLVSVIRSALDRANR